MKASFFIIFYQRVGGGCHSFPLGFHNLISCWVDVKHFSVVVIIMKFPQSDLNSISDRCGENQTC